MERASIPMPPEAEALLAELEQLESWEAAAATEDLRTVIAERRASISARFARAMLAWKRGQPSDAGATASSVDAPMASVGAATRALTRIPSASGSPGTVVMRRSEPRVEAWRAEPRPTSTWRAEVPRQDWRSEARGAYDRFGPARPRTQASDMDAPWTLPPVDATWNVFVSNLLRDIGTSTSSAAELDAIVHAIEGWERWRTLPSDVQRAMAAWLAARLHVIQDRGFSEDARVSHGFSLLSAFMKRARPGFVHGLARGHRPLRGTWDEDADVLVAGLEELLPPEPEPTADQKRRIAAIAALAEDVKGGEDGVREAAATQLRRDVTALLQSGLGHRTPALVDAIRGTLEALDGAELRPLRRWIRALTHREREFAADVERPPEDWQHWDFVRGKRVMLVGGTPREIIRSRLEQTFAMGTLAWFAGEPRRGASPEVSKRLRDGAFDLVIILRAAGGQDVEDEVLPLCEDHEVPCITVDHGWSAGRIQQAIERRHAVADAGADSRDDDGYDEE